MDPAQSTALLTVFGLGSTWGTFTLGPIIRQVTEDLAWGLSQSTALTARPHHLMVDGGVDPNLDPQDQGPQDDGPPRIRFILPHALPSRSLVRTLAAQQGTPLALTGRLDLHRTAFELALNVWDTGPPNLLYCAWEEGESDTLLQTLASHVGRIRRALSATEELGADATTVFGTESWGAFEAYAAATDKIRTLQVSGGGGRAADIPRILSSALTSDPDYEKPRILLLEHAMRHLRNGDKEYAQTLMDAVNTLRGDRVVYGLLRFEALLVLEKEEAARALLTDLRKRFANAPALTGAAQRLAAAG
jgi:hypothetical protein